MYDQEKVALDKGRSGTEALVEMGVKTGLRLLFALLRQSWQQSPAAGDWYASNTLHLDVSILIKFFFLSGTLDLCNEVLHTACDVVRSLPPLSLANENKITQLGIDSLQEVTKFLKLVTLPSSNTDNEGKQLASELLLGMHVYYNSFFFSILWWMVFYFNNWRV